MNDLSCSLRIIVSEILDTLNLIFLLFKDTLSKCRRVLTKVRGHKSCFFWIFASLLLRSCLSSSGLQLCSRLLDYRLKITETCVYQVVLGIIGKMS